MTKILQNQESNIDSNYKERETPIFLAIMRKGGICIYSKTFSAETKIDDMIFSGFLMAFNTFSSEFFEEKLDRAKFGEYLILMRNINPFVLCYVIKYNSYIANQKLGVIIQEIQQNPQIWDKLLQAEDNSEFLNSSNFPALDKLITKNIRDKN